MRKHFLHIAAALTILFVVGITASAQTTKKMTVTVPFDFYVGKTALPAGTYTVYGTSTTSGDGFLLADNGGSHTKVLLNGQQVHAKNSRSVARLEFRRYDDKYFLARVWSAGSNIGRELKRSRLERDTAKSAERNIARKDVKTEFITVTSD